MTDSIAVGVQASPPIQAPARESSDNRMTDGPARKRAIPANINNAHDLKLAELKGDQFSISQEQMVKAIEQAIKAVQGRTTELSFSIHKQTKMISVKVLDRESGDVIREIPPEKTLDFIAKLWEMAGIIIDERR